MSTMDISPAHAPQPGAARPPREGGLWLSKKEVRVLRVIPETGFIRHGDVRPLAKMDTSTCIQMLRRLLSRAPLLWLAMFGR